MRAIVSLPIAISRRWTHLRGKRLWCRHNVTDAAALAQQLLVPKAAKFSYEPVFQPDAVEQNTVYRKIDHLSDGLRIEHLSDGRQLLQVEPWVLSSLSQEAFSEVNHLFRRSHLELLRGILHDKEASPNDVFVARKLLENAVVAARRQLPSCQDTGTATVFANKGHLVMTDGNDSEHLSRGVYDAYVKGNLRYSQMAPLGMFVEKNTRNNLPAQIDIHSTAGSAYDLLFIAKGGGSSNKTKLVQKTKAILREDAFLDFVSEEIRALGTAACPPYYLSIVVGGLSPDMTMKAVKLMACREWDGLPREGNSCGRAIRDVEWENRIKDLCHKLGVGAQYGGKYFVHDVRVARLPRHGGSCPVGISVSCSADRQIRARISAEGVFLEELEPEPEKYLKFGEEYIADEVHHVNLDENPRVELTKYPVSSRVLLNGTMLVMRDIAHAQVKAMLDRGEPLPDYLIKHPLFYAGPSKTPSGMLSGSFGPTSAVRMDPYVEEFQRHGGSLIMIGKGNRTEQVTHACKKYGGFYLGAVGGMAAQLSSSCIKSVEVLDMPDLGMEAVFKVKVEDFPAFIVIDDKGNDFFSRWTQDKSRRKLPR